jgi:hypothetical protein
MDSRPMTHSNLTSIDVSKYFGAKVVTKDGTTGTIVGVFSVHQSCNILLQDNSISIGYLLSDCHLLLKPLSELSDEHVDEVWELLGNNPNYKYGKKLLLLRFIENDCEMDYVDDLWCMKDATILIDYLRSKGYDLDNFLNTNKAWITG